ncbi:patatin-like phospholipase family protein [Lacinutrix chionoecetis]
MKVEEFTSSVWSVVEDLREWKADQAESGKPFFMSEFWDEDGNQYVNLVQEGGGMLGIALAGFTYVLEKVGIRFLGLAGTSAGSINSYLMSAIGSPSEEKSERILRHLINKDFMDFIDGGKDAKALIKFITSKDKKSFLNFIANPIMLWNYWDLKKKKGMNPGKNFESWLDNILNWEQLCDGLELAYNGIYTKNWTKSGFEETLNMLTNNFHVFKAHDYCCSLQVYKKDEKSKTLNKCLNNLWSSGEKELSRFECTDLMVEVLKCLEKENEIKIVALTLGELDKNMKRLTKSIYTIRYGESIAMLKKKGIGLPALPEDTIKKQCILALITAELTTQTKVIFPEMADHYFQDVNKVNPSQLVRASMSVPLLFEPVRLKLDWMNPGDNAYDAIRKKWFEWCRFKGSLPKEVSLVDGGIMSNFPIDVFDELESKWEREKELREKNEARSKGVPYVKQYNELKTHTTTIGVKLGIDRDKTKENNTILGLLGQCFDNARIVRDFESINKNPSVSNESIAYIDTSNFNWLDFQMNPEDMKALFMVGAQTASSFVKSFNYKNYYNSRNSKSIEIVKDKLFNDVYVSDFNNRLYQAETQLEERKIIKQQEIDDLVDAIQLPKNVNKYWADANTKNVINYVPNNEIQEVKVLEVSNEVYNRTIAIQEKINHIKQNLNKKLIPDIRNIMLRISLIRSCFSTEEDSSINKFPVLWVKESVNFNDLDVNDDLLTEMIDFAGGTIDTINHEAEAIKVNDNIDYYDIIIVKAYHKDIEESNLQLFRNLKIESHNTVKIIAYVNDTNLEFIPNTHVKIYNNRTDLLHKILDNFHRNIFV